MKKAFFKGWILVVLAGGIPAACSLSGPSASAPTPYAGESVRRLEYLATAYDRLGMEYFTLAGEAEKRGEMDRVREYVIRAKRYKLQSADLKRAVDSRWAAQPGQAGVPVQSAAPRPVPGPAGSLLPAPAPEPGGLAPMPHSGGDDVLLGIPEARPARGGSGR